MLLFLRIVDFLILLCFIAIDVLAAIRHLQKWKVVKLHHLRYSDPGSSSYSQVLLQPHHQESCFE